MQPRWNNTAKSGTTKADCVCDNMLDLLLIICASHSRIFFAFRLFKGCSITLSMILSKLMFYWSIQSLSLPRAQHLLNLVLLTKQYIIDICSTTLHLNPYTLSWYSMCMAAAIMSHTLCVHNLHNIVMLCVSIAFSSTLFMPLLYHWKKIEIS